MKEYDTEKWLNRNIQPESQLTKIMCLVAKWEKRYSDMLVSAEEGFFEKGDHYYNVKEHHFSVAARQWCTAISELKETIRNA